MMTHISSGPLTNIAAALKMEPKIADRAKFVGMQGSVRRGYFGSSIVNSEYNVRKDVQAAKVVFQTPWKMGCVITPLDTCGIVKLEGSKFKQIKESKDPLLKALMENYYVWSKARQLMNEGEELKESSILFDTVAVFLAFREDYLKMEDLPIEVTNDGTMLSFIFLQCTEIFFKAYMVINEKAQKIRVATEWTDLGAYNNFLVSRLLSPTLPSLRNAL